MPELPEVETVVRTIRPDLLGKQIVGVRSIGSVKVFDPLGARRLNSIVANQEVVAVNRRGKYILIELASGGAITIHLRMTGRLLFGPIESSECHHLAAVIQCSDGCDLYFKDVRKFGRIAWVEDRGILDRRLGIEPLSQNFTVLALGVLLQHHSRRLKPLLLDQKVLAGLGNIYVDEVLWRAQLHPERVSNTVDRSECQALHTAIRSILKRAIHFQGTSFSDFYFGEGKRGRFYDQLAVFGQAGKMCRRCKTNIIKMRVAQRGTHICPNCQQK